MKFLISFLYGATGAAALVSTGAGAGAAGAAAGAAGSATGATTGSGADAGAEEGAKAGETTGLLDTVLAAGSVIVVVGIVVLTPETVVVMLGLELAVTAAVGLVAGAAPVEGEVEDVVETDAPLTVELVAEDRADVSVTMRFGITVFATDAVFITAAVLVALVDEATTAVDEAVPQGPSTLSQLPFLIATQ